MVGELKNHLIKSLGLSQKRTSEPQWYIYTVSVTK